MMRRNKFASAPYEDAYGTIASMVLYQELARKTLSSDDGGPLHSFRS
jgi:hypothetical protein